jgi:hypothetical protein
MLTDVPSALTHLEGSASGETYDAERLIGLDPVDGRPLLARYDLERAAATLTREALAAAADAIDLAGDPRTQPMQPPSLGNGPAVARGAIPKDWITGSDGQSRPASATEGPVEILRYILR